MKKLVKTLAATTAAFVATTQQASAEMTLWVMNSAARHSVHRQPHGRGHHDSHASGRHGHNYGHGSSSGGGGGAPSAPEIDVSQAAAAIVILLIAFLLIREIYLRQRPQSV